MSESARSRTRRVSSHRKIVGDMVRAEQGDIRPILEGECVSCHGGALPLSKRDLRTRETALTGGARGPVLVPGNADRSPLYRMVAGLEQPVLPMQGAPLDPPQLALLKQWIDEGARWDGAVAAPSATANSAVVAGVDRRPLTPEERAYWAFKLPEQVRFRRPNAWRYRDYVIRSFNADKPYDVFLTEQIAGDEMDGKTNTRSDPQRRLAKGRSSVRGRPLAQMAVHQFFRELDAEVLAERCRSFGAPIKGHAQLPRSREDFRIFDRRFVPQMIRTGPRIALDHMERVAVEVAGAIEPGLAVESGHIYD
jgi:hypothetical protein